MNEGQNVYAPAFPHVIKSGGRYESGMTLRDYFAAKAMAALLSDPTVNPHQDRLALTAYIAADAMLKARAA